MKKYRIVKLKDRDLYIIESRFMFLWCIPIWSWAETYEESAEPITYVSIVKAEKEIQRWVKYEENIIDYSNTKVVKTYR